MAIQDLDQIAAELTQELGTETLSKSLPPKIAYRFRAWMRKMHPKSTVEVKKMEQLLQSKLDEFYAMKTLAKNETMASVYDNGVVKLDFGAEVPEKIKKAAMAWARRRGLTATEATLAKSMGAPTSVTYAMGNPTGFSVCVKRIKWEA